MKSFLNQTKPNQTKPNQTKPNQTKPNQKPKLKPNIRRNAAVAFAAGVF
jgi:capsular polysaccharide biosynthesis protein